MGTAIIENRFRRFAALALISTATMLLAGCAASGGVDDFHMIGGSFPETGGPDGNTYIYDSPDGLIVIDTGRHVEHSRAILDYAKAQNRPIAAIVKARSTGSLQKASGRSSRCSTTQPSPATGAPGLIAQWRNLRGGLADRRGGLHPRRRAGASPRHGHLLCRRNHPVAAKTRGILPGDMRRIRRTEALHRREA